MTDDTTREDPPFVVRMAGRELITGDDIFDTINNVAEPQPKLRRIMPRPADDIPPQVELPRLVDDCNSKTYDAAKARLAYLEDWRVRQQHETGKLLGRLDEYEQAITRVRTVFADWQGSDETRGRFATAILAALDGDTPKEQP